ncbi:ASCH domain-containing protein [bacterium]|nr:ASCH domain-containing protein [candidate division CSSED10-310 bacterium]
MADGEVRTIRFEAHLVDLILRGVKTATTRIGRRRFTPGQQVLFAGPDNLPRGMLRITGVDHLSLEELDDPLAAEENLPSATALKAELRRIYGARIEKEPLTVIRFHLFDRFDPPTA